MLFRSRRAPSPWHVEGCLIPCSAPCRYLTCMRDSSLTFGAPGRGLRRVFNLDTAMASTRAERVARRTASMANTAPASNQRGRSRAGGAPERHADPEPHVEHVHDLRIFSLANSPAPKFVGVPARSQAWAPALGLLFNRLEILLQSPVLINSFSFNLTSCSAIAGAN